MVEIDRAALDGDLVVHRRFRVWHHPTCATDPGRRGRLERKASALGEPKNLPYDDR